MTNASRSAAGHPRQITRRQFLRILGAVAGGGAVFGAMRAWDLTAVAAQETPPRLEGSGNGTRVIILGAGPAGCATAYELANAGYEVQILEARERVGGRVFTVRRSAELTEYGGEHQICDFDEGQFFDAGAWRIPYFHRATLHYCKEFGITLQPHKNINLNAYVHVDEMGGPEAGQTMRLRELMADMGGYTAELLAKAASQDRLDADLSAEDKDHLIEYLIAEGLLSRDDLSYKGGTGRGYDEWPGAGLDAGVISSPTPLRALLPFASVAMQSAGYYIASVAAIDQQETMLHPVGGMSQIYEDGFQRALGERIRFGAEVQEIRQDEAGVRIVYRDLQTDKINEATGDFCVCTLPLSVLIRIPSDFSGEMRQAIQAVPYDATGKIGLQMRRRFWEEDDWIYGGMTLMSNWKVGVIAYPDGGYLSQKGVVQGYYNYDVEAIEISNLSLRQRIEFALEHGSQVHPTYREDFESAFSIAWHRVPYSMGGWANYTDRVRQQYYPRLLEPDGRVYLAGEHLSHVTSWQEGAFVAAWMQIDKLHRRAMQQA